MSLRATLKTRWDSLAPRERTMLAGAMVVVALAFVWWVLLGPALSTLRAANAQHRELDVQLQAMHKLQAEALALQNQPKMSYDDALRALETSVTQRLAGTGQLNVVGERATVTLRSAQPETLARWLTQARVNARAVPSEVRLSRNPTTAQQGIATWDGTLVLTLPQR